MALPRVFPRTRTFFIRYVKSQEMRLIYFLAQRCVIAVVLVQVHVENATGIDFGPKGQGIALKQSTFNENEQSHADEQATLHEQMVDRENANAWRRYSTHQKRAYSIEEALNRRVSGHELWGPLQHRSEIDTENVGGFPRERGIHQERVGAGLGVNRLNFLAMQKLNTRGRFRRPTEQQAAGYMGLERGAAQFNMDLTRKNFESGGRRRGMADRMINRAMRTRGMRGRGDRQNRFGNTQLDAYGEPSIEFSPRQWFDLRGSSGGPTQPLAAGIMGRQRGANQCNMDSMRNNYESRERRPGMDARRMIREM